VSHEKCGDTKLDSFALLTHCLLEPLVSLPAMLFLLLSSPKWLKKKKSQKKQTTPNTEPKQPQTSACLGGSAVSSYLMLPEVAGERVLLWPS